MSRVRLQRFLAQAGIASRRRSEDLIAAGVVQVNGRVVTEPGTTVDPVADEVRVKGRSVRARFAEDSPGDALGIALNKPRGVLTARTDARGRRTVYDLVEEPRCERLAYVARLGFDPEGLLLLTTPGGLAHRVTHRADAKSRSLGCSVPWLPRGTPAAVILNRARETPRQFAYIVPFQRRRIKAHGKSGDGDR